MGPYAQLPKEHTMQLWNRVSAFLPAGIGGLAIPRPFSRRSTAHLRIDEWHAGTLAARAALRTALPARLRLDGGALHGVTLWPRQTLRLTCEDGVLWITRDRDTEDYVLTRGKTLDVSGPGAIVVLAPQWGCLLVEAGSAGERP